MITNMVILVACMSIVESGGHVNAFNRGECAIGVLQIRQQAVADINRHYRMNLTLEDYRNPGLSAWAVLAYAHIYHARKPHDIAVLWNAGPKWRGKRTAAEEYWRRVLEVAGNRALGKPLRVKHGVGYHVFNGEKA